MGDVVTLVEKAQETIDEKKALEIEKKIRKDTFTLDDFKSQLQQIKRMGSVESLLSMIPGFNTLKKAKGVTIDEKGLLRVEAIIDSMTMKERKNPVILNAKRRVRIARGSGATVEDVNRMIKQYNQMLLMMKRFKKGGMKSLRGILPI